jgi:radical SAM superfamily enzyme YgiQ (UPF0313 family)
MHIILWDTRHGGAFKDFAGGFGVGQFRGHSLREKLIERQYTNDFRAPPLAFAYLAAGFRERGHTVEYALEQSQLPAADLYVLNPALMTLPHELETIAEINRRHPQTQVLVVGQVASTMAETFAGLNCRVLQGEPEQLLWKLDEVLQTNQQVQSIGTVANLDTLPFPDWSVFPYQKFRVGYDFWKFPTAYIQSSRGCTLSCSYCPYIILENKVRTRSAGLVGEELRRGMKLYGFQSFKFRDPLFGAKKKHLQEVAAEIGRLPRKIQFSVESRIEHLTRETLEMLRDVGLTSVTVGIETPSRDTLVKYKRAPVKGDKQGQFVDLCRELGVRVVSGFMIGFPEDTRASIREVLRYAKQVNPYAANFNVCTPYPGTGFISEIQDKIASRDWSRYDVYTPNLKYEHLTTEEVAQLHRDCFRQYYWRWAWLRGNWQFLFPRLNAAVSGLSQWFQPTPASSPAKTDEGVAPPPAVAPAGSASASLLPIVDAGPVAEGACSVPPSASRKAA